MNSTPNPLGEAAIRSALEEVLTVAFAERLSLLTHPNLDLELVESNHLGLCVVARDHETNAEAIRCMVGITARKVPSPPVSVTVTPVCDDSDDLLESCASEGCEREVIATHDEMNWCGQHLPGKALAPKPQWREGTWGPRPILDARGKSMGLNYSDTPVGGDIVLPPVADGETPEEYRVVRGITAVNPAEVTVVSVTDEAKTYTFPVDSSAPVRFRRAEYGRAIETVLAAFPGSEVVA